MSGYIERAISTKFRHALAYFPVLGLIGPRQCGKSTFVRHYFAKNDSFLYLDLENPADLAKLSEPLSFFEHNSERLVCLDEIQKKPDLFKILRGLVDKRKLPGQFIVLGSASPELLRQSSETLAGRIAYIELTPFVHDELHSSLSLNQLWLRGGFPRSVLAPDDTMSLWWRDEFIRTYLERDVPQWGFRIPSETISRLWRMLAHEHGQVLNSSRLAQSLGVSPPTIRSYIDILKSTYMIRSLPAFLPNLGKRLVKSPRVFIRDTGILHALSGLETFNCLLGHPCFGASWEGLVIENAIAALPDYRPHFFRTKDGAEIDLVLERGNKRIAIEAKASQAPTVTKGFWNAIKDVDPIATFVASPVSDSFPMKKDVMVCSLGDLTVELKKIGSKKR